MIAGITEKEQKIIERILDKYRKDYAFFYYGSRVKGTFEKTSDLDILVKGKAEMPLAVLQEIKEEFDNSNLPYIVNFSDYYKLDGSFYKRIKLDLIPYNWQEVKLGDDKVSTLIGDGLHGTPAYTKDGDYAFINGNNLLSGYVIIKPDTKLVSKSEYLKYKKNLTSKTLFVSINGTLGNIAEYNNEKIILGKSVCYLNIASNIEKRFIKYVLLSPVFQNYLHYNATGTTIKNVSLKQIREYSFILPPLDVQKKIAGVLGALDDKIELNNKINQNLEAQAQALFKSWFIDFEPFGGKMPIDWKEYKLSDFLPVITGKKNANVSSKKGRYPFFSCSQNISWTNEYSFDANAILVAGNGDFNIKFYKGKFEAYQRTYVLIPRNPYYAGWLYYVVKHSLDLITNSARGSVIKFITKGNLENFEFVAPINLKSNSVISAFNTINENVLKNIEENLRLAELRDTLLPKLMNGEIDVDNVKID